MFKRLFFLSGIIAFALACAVMYFWYLPRQATSVSATTDQIEVSTLPPDSVKASLPEE